MYFIVVFSNAKVACICEVMLKQIAGYITDIAVSNMTK